MYHTCTLTHIELDLCSQIFLLDINSITVFAVLLMIIIIKHHMSVLAASGMDAIKCSFLNICNIFAVYRQKKAIKTWQEMASCSDMFIMYVANYVASKVELVLRNLIWSQTETIESPEEFFLHLCTFLWIYYFCMYVLM